MQIVKALADARVLDDAGQPAYTLLAQERYVLYDAEAGRGVQAGALKKVDDLSDALSPYRGEPLEAQRLILPFIGRSGDAIVTASCVAALKERYAGVTVDIACLPAIEEVLRLMPRFGDVLPYPLSHSSLANYDYYLAFEDVEKVPDGVKRSCADLFSACLHAPRPSNPPQVTIPVDVQDRMRLVATGKPRVAVQLGRPGSLKTYPYDLITALIGRLAGDGFDVYLIGSDAASVKVTGQHAQSVHDLLGRTPLPADLAAVLAQMDAVVTGDSFPLHLAGALGVPTIAIFATTEAVIAADYPTVTALRSDESCSPCHVVGGACPLGHNTCIAYRHPSLDPNRIAEAIRAAVAVGATSGAAQL